MRVVAIGDSIAYGVGDHPRSAGDISWSGRLARMAGSDDHRIFGYPGAMLKDMRSIQVPALKLVQPDLVLVSIGGNDAVRTGFNAEALREGVHESLAEITASGSQVALVTLPNFSIHCRLPRRMRIGLQRRIIRVNAILTSAANQPGVTLIDRWSDSRAHEPEYLHADRVHPSPLGYQWLAESTLAALGIPLRGTGADTSMPEIGQRLWLLTKGVPWAIRRSSSLLPGILGMAWDDLRNADAYESR